MALYPQSLAAGELTVESRDLTAAVAVGTEQGLESMVEQKSLPWLR